jgi:hypothetical protein
MMVQQDRFPNFNITSLNLALLYGETTKLVFYVFTQAEVITQMCDIVHILQATVIDDMTAKHS